MRTLLDQIERNEQDDSGRVSFNIQSLLSAGTCSKYMVNSPVRLLAFYLPQFHPITENDTWWGQGFTDWTNVAKARPLFTGHYQPHIPADLGFYDLRLPEARQAQADLAREYCLSGFIYYHYWFGGRRLLERPFAEVLASGKPDFPFCLCWANENWTRVWDGNTREVLIAQKYSEEDDRAHIRWLLNVFRDRRYIRVGNKPLILIYRANQLPDPRRTTALWREEARKNGIGELFICRVESFPDERTDPHTIGFDAAVEFQPDWTDLSLQADSADDDHTVLGYATFVEQQLQKPAPPYLRFPCVTPSWDNSPRRQNRALILTGSTPRLYARWLRTIIERLPQGNDDTRLVFINAWNEWGEGNHLEPDLVFGRRYLEATRGAVNGDAEAELAVTQTDERDESATGRGTPLDQEQRRLRSELQAKQRLWAVLQEQRQLQSVLQEQTRWARELEAIVREQQEVIHSYQRLLGPLLPFARAARTLKARLTKRR